MDQNQDIPTLLSFYFGDSASHASHAASARLKRWSRAFDRWLSEGQRTLQKDTLKHTLLAWKRLVRQSGKLPWQLTPSDIDQHLTWLKQEGFADPTINGSLGYISSFYQWVDQHRLDSSCPSGFNPARDIARLSLKPYNDAPMWSLTEIQLLLDLLHRDTSPLGKRDYAFFLARLSLGVPLNHLRCLAWGQLEQRQPTAWVRWRPDSPWVPLPPQVWEAIVGYLQSSARLPAMSSAMFIFAPQVTPVLEGSGAQPFDWLEHQPLSNSALHRTLKRYGRKIGISAHKLTFAALRRTAIRLRFDQGETLEGMQSFMDTREKLKSTRFRLARLPLLLDEDPSIIHLNARELSLPIRISKPLTGDEGTTHGFYSSHQDAQAVKLIQAENIGGIEQEISCLRELMRGLLDLDACDSSVVEVYSQAAQRLAGIISVAHGNDKEKDKQNTWAEDLLSGLDKIAVSQGLPIVSPQIRQDALAYSPESSSVSGKVSGEVATLRLMLRNVYRHALLKAGTHEYIHLVDLYSRACVRLSRLLKSEGSQASDRLVRYLKDGIDEAIRQVHAEWASGESDP